MTVNRRALVSVALGLCLTLGGCSPTSPTPVPPPKPGPTPLAKQITNVKVTLSSVAKVTITPERFAYTFRLQLADSGGAPYTLTSLDFEFDNGSDPLHITGDQLGDHRRLTTNGTLDFELTCVPAAGVYVVGNEVFSAYVQVNLTDDNGNRFFATSSIIDL